MDGICPLTPYSCTYSHRAVFSCSPTSQLKVCPSPHSSNTFKAIVARVLGICFLDTLSEVAQ